MDPVSATVLATTAASAAAPAAASAAVIGPGLISGGLLSSAITAPLTTFAAGSEIAADAGLATAGLGGLNFARMFNIGSTIFNSAGSLLGGIAQSKEKKAEATQLDQAAKARVAAATQEMQIEGRNTDLALSKARNNAAAGGGALDPSVVNILGDLEKQGARNEANTLDNANSAAHSMEAQAVDDRFMAKQSMMAGGIGAVTSMFSGLGKSMSAKYGYDDTTSTVSYA